MRITIVAGAAAVALGTMLTPAVAGPFWFLGKVISECVEYGVHDKDAPQVQCAYNSIDDESKSNDWNTQRVRQTQNATIKGVYDTIQLQIGKNNVEEGDGNTQKVKQSQTYNGPKQHEDDVQQLQVGVNNVEDGDDNTQTIKQSQTLTVGYQGGGSYSNN